MKLKFDGAKADYNTILGGFDVLFVKILPPKVPHFIETHHLTLFTIFLALLNLYVGWLLRFSSSYILLLSLSILLQHCTDLLDGAVGRYRNTGLELWGYYMDKFVDFVFMGSLCLCFTIAMPNMAIPSLLIFFGYGGLMVQSFLMHAATGKSEKNYRKFGPTEVKALTIMGTVIVFFAGLQALPVFLLFAAVALLIVLTSTVFKAQRILWAVDMERKKTK